MFNISLENQETFVLGVANGLRNIGATLNNNLDLGGLAASIKLETRAGTLMISLYYTQLYSYRVQGVFEDVNKARELFDCDENGLYTFSSDTLFTDVNGVINSALEHFEKTL